MALVLITPSAATPVSLAEVKAHLRLIGDEQDALLTLLIKAATDQGQNLSKAQFVAATYELVLDSFPATAHIELPRPPLQSVTSVKYLDAAGTLQTLALATGYKVDADRKPGRVHLPYSGSWPDTYGEPNAVRVRYVTGWPVSGEAATTPEAIKQWLLIRVATLYEHRESVVTGSTVSPLPPNHLDGLLDPYTYPTLI